MKPMKNLLWYLSISFLIGGPLLVLGGTLLMITARDASRPLPVQLTVAGAVSAGVGALMTYQQVTDEDDLL